MEWLLSLSEDFFPYPEDDDWADDTENEVLGIAASCQLDIKQSSDERAHITACNTDDDIHATSFAFATHDAVCNVTNKQTRQDGPCGE